MKGDIAILGCGPAGLMAAHACEMRGVGYTIYSRFEKSSMYGAMYLHKEIPGVSGAVPDLDIMFIKAGCREGYAENVYGSKLAPCSWDQFPEGMTRAWSLKKTYDRLWEIYCDKIVEQEVTREWMQDLVHDHIVFCTIPKPSLCDNVNHNFAAQPIWVLNKNDHMIGEANIIYYNGFTPDGKYGKMGDDWYRFSYIDGLASWEYSFDPGTNLYANTWRGKKPLGNNCDCNPFVHFLGRFGKWEKGVLTHHAYREAVETLALL